MGGLFIAKPDSALTLDNTGTYWVGGTYGEVAGTIDQTPAAAMAPASGAVAGVIGIDNTDGTAKSYAGYFQGDLRATGYIQLALTSGAPPAADCDESSERGRMKVDSFNGLLYICGDTGWIAK